jgi:hypothetical protein
LLASSLSCIFTLLTGEFLVFSRLLPTMRPPQFLQNNYLAKRQAPAIKVEIRERCCEMSILTRRQVLCLNGTYIRCHETPRLSLVYCIGFLTDSFIMPAGTEYRFGQTAQLLKPERQVSALKYMYYI